MIDILCLLYSRCPLRRWYGSVLLIVATTGFALETKAVEVTKSPTVTADTVLVDSFDSVSQWSTNPAAGVQITLHSDSGLHGRGMRVDFDFNGHPGYGIVRRQLNLDLPRNYEFRFAVRGEASPNTLEFKLVHPNDSSVWWSNNPNFIFPHEWRTIARKKREICFAWGPMPRSPRALGWTPRGEIRHVGALEFAITAGTGGKGSVWIDDLSLIPLDLDSPFAVTEPVASAPIVGTWESAVLEGDGTGAKLDFAADGSFSSTVGVMATFRYSIANDRMSTEFGDARDPRTYRFTNSFRIENDTLIQKGENLFGRDIRMTRIGSVKGSGAPISGVWSYVDYTGATAYAAFDENGRGFFRIPLQECSGSWTASTGHLTVNLNGQIAEREYSIENDVLTLRYPGKDIKYNRRTRAP